MVENGVRPVMIAEQYRMHPEISLFPSRSFYESRLVDAASVLTREMSLPIQYLVDRVSRYAFIDLQASQEECSAKSYSNPNEAKLIIALINELHSAWKSRNLKTQDTNSLIGVITPYRKQVSLLRKLLHSEHLEDAAEVNTVDSFQGREKDIVIISTVRAGGRSVGFLMDYRRMNVAITRAKHFLWVVGSSSTLVVDQYWKELVGDARKRGLVKRMKDEKDTKQFWLNCNNSSYLNVTKKRRLPGGGKEKCKKLTAKDIRDKLF